jgi:RNA-directed DNA polymerase
MRNNNEQHKKAEALTSSKIGRAETRMDAKVELLSRLERQRTLTNTLLEKIVDYENLEKARNQVMKNGGSGGVDGMDVKELEKWLWKNITHLRNDLLTEQYKVSPVRKVEIPKPQGGTRMLGIPTIKDRLVQQAIYQRLNEYYDKHFSEHSYGFRPGRHAGQAILQAAEYVKSGHEWVVDIDLEKFFDKINHDRLMSRLKKGIGDKKVLRLINEFLKAGMMEDGLVQQRTSGTPQGGPLSPLLSNIVLDELDRELEARGHKFCRYADDCNIFVKSQKSGERVLESVITFIEGKLKLKVNREKSGVRHCSDVKFLGYTLMEEGKIRVSDKSIDRLTYKIKAITKRNRGVSFTTMIEELNKVIVGWANYYKLANTWLSTIRDLDGWIRRKLRCYKLKQSQRPRTTHQLLCSLGASMHNSWNVVMYRHGWWSMSLHPTVSHCMNPAWFARQGLQSLYSRLCR